MASGNRVEELESRVKELEATVDGLTDELIECKVRVRELENHVDGDVGLDAVGERSEDETDAPESADGAAEVAEEPKSEAPEGEDNTESDETDIIVA